MSRTLFHTDIARRYKGPFMYLAEGLEKYIAGQKLVISEGAIPAAGRFFLSAHEGAKYNERLPELEEKYQRVITYAIRRIESAIPARCKLEELYERATGIKLENAREIGLAAVRFLDLLDNLKTQPDLEIEERQQYNSLLQFSKALIQDPESQKMRR